MRSERCCSTGSGPGHRGRPAWGGGNDRMLELTEVRFIRGDEKLRPLAGMLKGGNFNFVFPDETTTKVLRRGTLFCDASGCSFLMLSPEYISSVD